MRVTVCEMADDPTEFDVDWRRLVEHVRSEKSDFVLLPEMPFHPWLAGNPHPDDGAWQAAVDSHRRWLERLVELAPAAVAGTKPVVHGGQRLNEAFVWHDDRGLEAAHHKVYLPDEEGFWEASWYERGADEFQTASVASTQAGFLICTELWFSEHARQYGRQGAQLILCPRATPGTTSDKWLAGGRCASVVAGAFCLSSNRTSTGPQWGGLGWIVHPEEGLVIATTSRETPFVTRTIHLGDATAAKNTYPRYVDAGDR